MAAHVLVVANVTATSTDLIDAIKARAERSPIDVTLLMPGHGPGARRAARPCAGGSTRRSPSGRRPASTPTASAATRTRSTPSPRSGTRAGTTR